jgi:probable biosynthetic protein (TIGR04098 family)
MNWLLRECCHRHWWALAESLRTSPTSLVDESGVRAFASVVAAVVSGRPSGFAEDEIVSVHHVTPPRAANGWRSETLLAGESGAFLTIEIVTAFARRNGSSNHALERARMPVALSSGGGSEGARARLLQARGRAERAAALNDGRPPHLSFSICPETHLNGVGLMYFANFVDCFAQTERTVVPPLVAEMTLASRELHYFGNIDPGDALDVLSDVSVVRLHASPRVDVTSSARRRSDGAVIATCRSEWTGE